MKDKTIENLKDKATQVKLENNPQLGQVLTDTKGMTLYYFSMDTDGKSACMDKCVEYWPIFFQDSLIVGEGLNLTDFGAYLRPDKKMQSTYMGWPLYYFKDDAAEGDVTGESVNDIWFVAKPDYTVMYAKAQLVGGDGKYYKGDYTEGDEETFYLTDAKGRTLYAFVQDAKNKNNYTKEDFSNNALWPIVECSEIGAIPSKLLKDDFGLIDVHGKSQLTYKGWPLYYFGEDLKRGDTKGVTFPKPGVWPIVNSDTAEAK